MTTTTSPDLIDERLARLLDDVVRTHIPLAVFLFGSRAEGRATATSDYDLLVVPSDEVQEAALDLRAFQSGLRVDVCADIIPTTKEVFLACKGNLSTLEGIAQARGRLLYGAV